MTVKDPVTRASGHPGHRHRRRSRHPLRNCFPPACRGVDGVTISVPATVDVEVKAVQVHGMRNGAGVDDAPANRVAEIVGESFGMWPRTPVDGAKKPSLPRNELSLHLTIGALGFETQAADRV